MVYLVSSCLAGIRCRYDGKECAHPQVVKLVMEGKALPVCPEVLGGLAIPRDRAEIVKNNGSLQVVTENGADVTKEYLTGADRAASIAQAAGVEKAILKSKSPSCASRIIYDGSFSNKLIPGQGLTALALQEKGILVLSEEDLGIEEG